MKFNNEELKIIQKAFNEEEKELFNKIINDDFSGIDEKEFKKIKRRILRLI